MNTQIVKHPLTRKVLAGAILALGLNVQAQPVPMLDGLGNGSARVLDGYTIGYTFTTGAYAISVTALGYVDWSNGSGLNAAHDVGIWDASGTLIASVTVPAGTAGTFVNHFWYANLDSPVTLDANTTYTIGGVGAGGDQWPNNNGTTSPGFTLPDFTGFPALTAANNVYIGGGFAEPTTAGGGSSLWNVANLLGGLPTGGTNSAPTFGPAAGRYYGAQLVTAASDPGTTIHYTTDGSDPTTSVTAISGPSPITGIIVPAGTTTTIKAYATKTGQTNSAVASASYDTTAVSQPRWTNPLGGSWPVAASWANSVVGGGPDATADFSQLTLPADANVTLDGSQLIGNLIFGDQGNTYNWNLSPGTGGTLTLAGTTPTITVSSQTTTIGAAIAGTAGLAKAGAGNLILTGANTYTGATTVPVGTLQLGDGTVNVPVSSGNYAISGGAKLYLNYATASGPINGSTTWSNISGAGIFELNSAQAVNGSANWGQPALPGGFTGTLQIDNGRVNGNPTNFGGASTIVVNNGAQFLAYDGTSATYTFTNNFVINGLGWGESGYNNGALRASSMTTIFTGNIILTGDSGIFTQIGSQPMTVTGPISDGGSGYGLTINGAANSPITLTGTNTFTGPMTINATAGLIIGGAGQLGGGTYAGDIADSSVFIDNSSAAQTLSGSISGTGGLTMSGAGTLTLNGANTYSGATTVSGGTLIANGPLGSGALTVNAGGTLAANGTNTLSDVLTFNAGGTNVMHIAKAAGPVLTSDLLSSTIGVTYGGNLTVTATGAPLALGDTFTLFNSSGTYAGSFTSFKLPALPAGLSWDVTQLAVNGSIKVGNVTGIPVFYPPGGNYITAQSVTISSLTPTATIHYTTDGSDPTTSGTVISGASPVTVSVPVPIYNMTLMAYATMTGQPASSVQAATYNTVGTPTWMAPIGGSWSTPENWSNSVVANGSGWPADFSTLTLPADTAVYLDIPATVGSLAFGDRGNAFNWVLSDGGVGPLTLDAGTNTPVITVVNMNTTIAAVLAGTKGFLKAGAGTLTLAGVNTYTGGATVSNSSTLKLDLSARSGQAALDSFFIGSSGTLELYNTSASIDNLLLLNTTFTGSGTINKTGSGQFSIWNGSSIKNFTGQINVQAGILSANNCDWGSGAGLMSVDISAGASLDDRYVTDIVIDKLTGLGTVGNSYVQARTIRVGNNNGSSSFGGSIVNTIVSGSGSMALTKAGTGTFTLTGASTYTGATTISNGTLVVNGSLAATATTVRTGGTLGGTGVIGGAVVVDGTLAPGSNGLGTLAITNALTLNAGSLTKLAIDRTSGTGTYGNVQGITTASFGGTLTVTSLGGTFQAGDTFTLFSASASTNDFAVKNLPALASGLVWQWTPASGTLQVVAGLTPPTLSGIGPTAGGFVLTFSGPSGQTYKMLGSTNVALPLTSWSVLTNGTFGASPVKYTNTPATAPHEFYRVVSP
jgi:fibronectin-binding autotransporter adhesin